MDKTQVLTISEALAMTENIPEVFAKLLELQDEGYLTVEMGIKDDKPFLSPMKKTNPTSTSVHVPSTDWNRDDKILVKAVNEEKRYTLSPWYIPQSVDAHGEWTDREEVQQAFWDYLALDNRDIRLQHNLEIVAGQWVEGLTWPHEVKVPVKHPDGEKEYTFPAGTPFLGVVWQPWAWELIKSGDLRGLSIGGKAQRFDEEMDDDDYDPMGKVKFNKAEATLLYKESYSPPKVVQTNAKRALRWIEEGKAGSGFTSVGRRRANQLANGENVSLRTLARIKSYLSRHQSDKKAVGFDYGEKNFPSAGRVAYDAWGGDEGLRWASNILDRMEKHLPGRHDQSSHGRGNPKYPKPKDKPAATNRNAEAVALAVATRGKYSKVENERTELLDGLAQKHGGEMYGLQYRLKDSDSLARKIHADSIEKQKPMSEIAESGIYDVNRYTMVLPADRISAGGRDVLTEMEQDGFTIVEIKNTLKTPNAPYRGVNVKAEKDGLFMELQLHTSESIAAKSLNHPKYTISRETADPNLLATLTAEMQATAAAVPIPPDIELLDLPLS